MSQNFETISQDTPENAKTANPFDTLSELPAFEEHLANLEKAQEQDLENTIKTTENRVVNPLVGFSYENNPNVFHTNEGAIYRITGFSQIADIVNCGYVRSKTGKHKGGTSDPIVYWSNGGKKLNYIDPRPIIETSSDTLKPGQIGALPLNSLTAIWITDPDTGKRKNRLDDIRQLRQNLTEHQQISTNEIIQKLEG